MIDLRPLLANLSPDSTQTDIMFNTGVSYSPFTGGAQWTELPGAKWKLAWNFQALEKAEGRIMKTVKALCRSGAEVVHIRDWSYQARRTAEPGNPRAAAGTQAGSVLKVSGLPANSPAYALGDQVSYLSTDGMYRMHMVTATVSSDGSGDAFVPILPPIRNPPAAATAIDSLTCSISVNLTDGGQVAIDGVVHSVGFVFTEALYAIL